MFHLRANLFHGNICSIKRTIFYIGVGVFRITFALEKKINSFVLNS